MASFTGELHRKLRAIVPVFTEDHYMSPDIRKINDYIVSHSLNL